MKKKSLLIYAGVNGFLRLSAVDKIQEFEQAFIKIGKFYPYIKPFSYGFNHRYAWKMYWFLIAMILRAKLMLRIYNN